MAILDIVIITKSTVKETLSEMCLLMDQRRYVMRHQQDSGAKLVTTGGGSKLEMEMSKW